MSFSAGDYEVNVYGNPEQPAGVEVGIRGAALDDPKAKANCLALITRVLSKDGDRRTLNMLKLEEDVQKTEGLTFEITPPTAEDSYGGWWVSVYDEEELDRSRATTDELAKITVPKKDIKDSPPNPAPKSESPGTKPSTNNSPWTPADLPYAKPGKGASGDRVYVRSYVRKDGTYVQAHTRAAPGSGGKRGK